jgi:hypothetical protein
MFYAQIYTYGGKSSMGGGPAGRTSAYVMFDEPGAPTGGGGHADPG